MGSLSEIQKELDEITKKAVENSERKNEKAISLEVAEKQRQNKEFEDEVAYSYRSHWYALLISILTEKGADDALRDMGIKKASEMEEMQ